MHLCLRLFSGVFLLPVAFGVQAACERPPPIVLNEAQIHDRQPGLLWGSVSGATEYRLHLRSRVPNGRVIAFYDAVTAVSNFNPPRALAEHKAKVLLRVNAACGDETSAESVAAFVIDTSPTCELGNVTAKAVERNAALDWQPVTGAVRYEVRSHTLEDGRLIAKQDTRAPGARIALAERGAVVSVRPACESGLGEAVYRVVVR